MYALIEKKKAIDHPPFSNGSSFFLCPRIRSNQEGFHDENAYTIIKKSHLSSEHRGDHHHIQPLHVSNNEEGEPNDFRCNACRLTIVGTTYYFCDDCDGSYHKECVEAPAEINVPGYHPKHPLQLSYYKDVSESRMVSHCCGNLTVGYFYYCSICGFSMHTVCAMKPTLLTIDHPQCHEHTLMYLHRKASMTCDVCGFDDERYFIYICLQCDFVVHKECIYLPRVIMLTRHDHRLSIISALPCGNWLCGVCHKQMNKSYGGYICLKGCEFAVHCSCATRRDVWDGRELEGVPDEYEDIMSFKKLSDGTVLYFSHPHHPLRLFEKIDGVDDESTYCQACILPLLDENAYKCENCDFNLHQTCADLPLRKLHLLHIHALILQKDSGNCYKCDACLHIFTGFVYVCSKGCNFKIDVKCSMVSEPFNYRCHPHPLFLKYNTPYGECWICSSWYPTSLNCIFCKFSSCFGCATLPYKVRYKHDDHFLNLSPVLGFENDWFIFEEFWCDVCEQEISSGGIYACNICSVSLHSACAIVYLFEKPGQSFQCGKVKVDVLPNISLTRPICTLCHRRCKYKLFFKVVNEYCVSIVCSASCLRKELAG